MAGRTSACIRAGNAPEELWTRLMGAVAERAAPYKLQIAAIGPSDMHSVPGKCYIAFKERAGLCVTTPGNLSPPWSPWTGGASTARTSWS